MVQYDRLQGVSKTDKTRAWKKYISHSAIPIRLLDGKQDECETLFVTASFSTDVQL